mmetsp:Transcript_97658/g.252710  ORF Transcript_97658/g.252710 Transcript_97658/m.252710 type:complete len:575 (-) Transcript_97658:148-1872(-)
MTFQSMGRIAPILLLALLRPVSASGFLGGKRAGHRSVGTDLLEVDLQVAMGEVLGCRSGAGSELVRHDDAATERRLAPVWESLPKNRHGRVEWRLLRYMTHRYFMQRSSLLVRGVEPSKQVNSSHNGAADILSSQVPAIAQMVLNGRQAEQGFSLKDAVAMVATLEQLIFDSDGALLGQVYDHMNASSHRRMDRAQMHSLLKVYMVHWMMGDDEEGADILSDGIVTGDESLLEQTFPQWRSISGLVEGTIRTVEYNRQHSGTSKDTLAQTFSFEDAHEVVGDIGQNFASFWEGQCQDIKTSLVAMDKSGTGRVRLSDFYGANLNGEWRFAESEAYLRQLGALDESSPWAGKQVIIPNYLQSASNCIVSRPHYLVCCVNECEDTLGDIERTVGAPTATPEDIIGLVGNMTDFESNRPLKLDTKLRAQLHSIADTHGGKVPLHGRLFAQWLHYVMPRECPFPHKAGASAAMTPAEYGSNYMATNDEVSAHASSANPATEYQEEDQQWMTQWSEEEELPGDYSAELRAPWERTHHMALGGSLALVGGLVWIWLKGFVMADSKCQGLFLPTFEKSHHV